MAGLEGQASRKPGRPPGIPSVLDGAPRGLRPRLQVHDWRDPLRDGPIRRAGAGSFVDNAVKVVTTQAPALWEKGFDQTVLDALMPSAPAPRVAQDQEVARSSRSSRRSTRAIARASSRSPKSSGKKRQEFSLGLLTTIVGEAAAGKLTDTALGLSSHAEGWQGREDGRRPGRRLARISARADDR